MIVWILLTVLLLLALAFLVWPLYRVSGRLTLLLGGCIVFVVGLSAALYHHIGHPGLQSGPATAPDTQQMVTSLSEKLKRNPNDVNGWQLLARSYQNLQQYDSAIAAYEKAIELQGGRNPQPLVALALVLTEADKGQFSERASGLLEDALALEPSNPNALFYSGFAAASRGDTALAADRWEQLKRQDAPPEISELLQEKIDEWRGGPAKTPTAGSGETVVTVAVSISDEAAAALPADATVYIIARDPAQPSPPIAVARRRMAELPMSVELGDQDSMVPGRSLSGFSTFELLARVSRSGNPIAQSGDWFGSLMIHSDDGDAVKLVIDRIVP